MPRTHSYKAHTSMQQLLERHVDAGPFAPVHRSRWPGRSATGSLVELKRGVRRRVEPGGRNRLVSAGV
ncbi:MAG: hypothetical protein AAB241_04960 [Pseudomonadota bacterium]